MGNLITFLLHLLPCVAVMMQQSNAGIRLVYDAAKVLVGRFNGLGEVLKGFVPFVIAKSNRQDARLGFWQSLHLRAMQVVMAGAMHSGLADLAYTVGQIAGVGLVVYTRTKVREYRSVLTARQERAIAEGELAAYHLFGPELYDIVSTWLTEAAQRELTANERKVLGWKVNAASLIEQGFVARSLGDGELTLVKDETLAAPGTPTIVESELDTIAGLLAKLLNRGEDVAFYRHGLTAVEAYADTATAQELQYATQDIGVPARVLAETFGGSSQALEVLARINHHASADQDGLTRVLRVIVEGLIDLGSEARFERNPKARPVFALGVMPNGVECVRMWYAGRWTIVLSSECERLRKCVVRHDVFADAAMAPSIVCAFGGKFLMALGTLQDYDTSKSGKQGVVAKVLSAHGFKAFRAVATANPKATRADGKDATRYLRWFRLPNLHLMMRVDHISAELATGRIHRSLIDEELDNVLVVANLLSRAQLVRSTGRLCDEDRLVDLLASGGQYGRVRRLFPRIQGNGMFVPGDLLVLGGRIHEELMNPRWADGAAITVIVNPDLAPDEIILPGYMRASLQAHGMKVGVNAVVKAAKMPNYVADELRVVAIDDHSLVAQVSAAWLASKNGDADGDQILVKVCDADAPMLSPLVQSGVYVRNYQMEVAHVGRPVAKDRTHRLDFEATVAGKGLIGVGVSFWRQDVQGITDLNPFDITIAKPVVDAFATEVVALCREYGYDAFVADGKPNWSAFAQEFPTGKDCFADLAASIFFEQIMPKAKIDPEAVEALAELGIAADEVRTLHGQLKIMDHVAVNPIATLRVYMSLDAKLIKRWLPRMIVNMAAVCAVCRRHNMTLVELIAHAPAGRLFHQSQSRWRHGLRSLMRAILGGVQTVWGDTKHTRPASDTLGALLTDPQSAEGNTLFDSRKVIDQRMLDAFLDGAAQADVRCSHKDGMAYIPVRTALELVVRYMAATEERTLAIIPHRNERGDECYALVETSGRVLAEGILARQAAPAPGDEFAELYYADARCSTCGCIVGYCAHTVCERCGKIAGTCKHPQELAAGWYTVTTGHLDPRRALAWLLTRPNVGDDAETNAVDTYLESYRNEIGRKVGGDAKSAGEAFNRMVRMHIRKIAYTPGLNVRRARGLARTKGINLDMVACYLPMCPDEMAKATHPAYAQVASRTKFGMLLARKYHLIPTTTSNGKPGLWMRHAMPKGHNAAFTELFTPAYDYTITKRDIVRIKAELSVEFTEGAVPMPWAWEGIPEEVLPQVAAPWVAFYAHRWAQLDQIALTKRYMTSVRFRRTKAYRVKKGMIVHLTPGELKDGFTLPGWFVGRRLLASDPTGQLDPVTVTQLKQGPVRFTAEFSGEFTMTDGHLVALSDGVITLSAVRRLKKGDKAVDFDGDKGNLVELPKDEAEAVVLVGGAHWAVEGYLAPSRFTPDKQQAGSAPVHAIFSQVRRLMVENGALEDGAVLRIPKEIPQKDMLYTALIWLYEELYAKAMRLEDEGAPDQYLNEKLAVATQAIADGLSGGALLDALWPLAFHPLLVKTRKGWVPVTEEVVDADGVTRYLPVEVMLSQHPLAVQPLYQEEANTIPQTKVDERMVKVDRFGYSTLNVRKNTSASGMALRRNYAGMTISKCPELMDELYSPHTLMRGDSAKVYLWEVILSCALQQDVIAFPELGPVRDPENTLFAGMAEFLAATNDEDLDTDAVEMDLD